MDVWFRVVIASSTVVPVRKKVWRECKCCSVLKGLVLYQWRLSQLLVRVGAVLPVVLGCSGELQTRGMKALRA